MALLNYRDLQLPDRKVEEIFQCEIFSIFLKVSGETILKIMVGCKGNTRLIEVPGFCFIIRKSITLFLTFPPTVGTHFLSIIICLENSPVLHCYHLGLFHVFATN